MDGWLGMTIREVPFESAGSTDAKLGCELV
jgi:hypothetical protein